MAESTYSQVNSINVSCEGTWKIEASELWMKIGNGNDGNDYSTSGSTGWDTAGQSITGITGNATIYVLVGSNKGTSERTGTITATVTSNPDGTKTQSATCTVTQLA